MIVIVVVAVAVQSYFDAILFLPLLVVFVGHNLLARGDEGNKYSFCPLGDIQMLCYLSASKKFRNDFDLILHDFTRYIIK